MSNELTTRESSDINLLQLNSKEKLKVLNDVLLGLRYGFYKLALSMISRNYRLFTHDSDNVLHPIEERIRIAFDSLNGTDLDISQVHNVSKSQVTNWRQDVVIVLYFSFKYSLKPFVNIDFIADETIENSATFKKLLRVHEETSFLSKLFHNKKTAQQFEDIPFLKEMVYAFIKDNDLKTYLIDHGIVDENDSNLRSNMSAYNKMFRAYFFEDGNTFGFLKLYKMIFWANMLKSQGVNRKLAFGLYTAYNLSHAKLRNNKIALNKFYVIRTLVEWLIDCDVDLEFQSQNSETTIKSRTGVRAFKPVRDYSDTLYVKSLSGTIPKTLTRILLDIATDPDAQSKVADELNPDIIRKSRITNIGILLGFLENILLDKHYASTEEKVISHLETQRNNTLISLRDIMVNLRGYEELFEVIPDLEP